MEEVKSEIINNESIETKYVSYTHKEHILARPDTYIGSIELINEKCWIYESDKIKKKNIEFSPGLYKIFDEILVNARDHAINTKTCNKIKVNINEEKNEISVWNNGNGIDIVIHEKHNIYVPELIFARLLTSTNYDDRKERITGGKNGYGAKLTNIFSKFFSIETIDNERKKKYYQEYYDNMTVINKPKITTYTKKPYTCIKFKPDFSKFKYQEDKLSDDMISVFKKRVYDIAGLTEKITVYFNDEKINQNTFEKYIKLYDYNQINEKLIYEKINERWEVGFYFCENNFFDHISFVNGIYTKKGGTHVNSIYNDINKLVIDKIKKKNTETKIKHIKDYIVLFINSIIVNPSFDSQAKNELLTKKDNFGSKYEIPDKFMNKIYKSELIPFIVELNNYKEKLSLKKTDGNNKTEKLKIEKLTDAEYAGTKNAKCKLILTEGDSAKTLAIAGISSLSNEEKKYYGIFALKGKILNTKDVSVAKLSQNNEFINLKKIIGLEQNTIYKNTDNLRYSSIIILSDQDSVVGDTPLLLRNNNKIKILNIEDLLNTITFNKFNNKEYGYCNYDVWTEKGWTKIKKIIRHKTTKKIYRILTLTGCVDVTEDHSLLNNNGIIKKPNQCKVGDKLLHNFPNEVILNNYLNYLKSNSELILSLKIVDFKEKNKTFFVKGKKDAQFIYLICKSLKYNIIINCGVSDIFELKIINDKIYDENKIIKILDLGYKDNYVYDLETDNHHFQAGIGEMIVHNTDGFHIKGLIINLFHTFWPSLLKLNFISSLATPIVKIFNNKKEKIEEFYNFSSFSNWKQNFENTISYNIKYYKGLGTSTQKDAKEYFCDVSKKITYYDYEDEEKNNKSIILAFDKNYTNERKEWIKNMNPNIFLDNSNKKIPIYDFINKELIFHSCDNIKRAIPSLVDGLKPSQRKILHTCFIFKKSSGIKGLFSDKNELKVSQLSGAVSEETDYHHGETSLQNAIIKMAQNFVGSNNINLLYPDGMFGSRLHGGEDHSSPRYIYTYLEKITKYIFRQEDNPILNYLTDDGNKKIEPEYFVPILPMILINGANGIGTGFSTKILSYNPLDIVKYIKNKLNGIDDNCDLIPWYKNFDGKIVFKNDKIEITGKVIVDKNIVKIIELPIETWTEEYKLFLDDLLKKKEIKNYTYNIDINKINFKIVFDENKLLNLIDEKNLFSFLKLKKTLAINNYHLFNKNNIITKYNCTKDIIDEFYYVRIEYYKKRKNYLINILNNDINILFWKIKFINDVISQNIIIFRQKKNIIIDKLEKLGYPKLSNNKQNLHDNSNLDLSYNYIINIYAFDFTEEKIEELTIDYNEKVNLLNNITNTSEEKLWLNELNEFEKEYIEFINKSK